MTKTLGFLGLVLAALCVACGGDDTNATDAGMGTLDAGADATAMVDSGPLEDSGSRADAGTDAGPSCTEGCGLVQVVAGFQHSCGRRENGSIRCWGGNEGGELGDDRMRHFDCTPVGEPDPVDCSRAPVDVLDIDDAEYFEARGGQSSCVVRESGGTWCWGYEGAPRPGSSGLTKNRRPVRIPGADDAIGVSTGDGHACIVRSNGKIACWGRNDSGQLGLGDTLNRYEPMDDVVDIDDAAVVAVGAFSHTCAILRPKGPAVGQVLCWGSNRARQLGDGATEHERCGGSGAAGYDCSSTPVVVDGLDDAIALSLGASHSCALRAGGSVVCWGSNQSGALGDGTRTDSSTPVEVATLSGVAEVSAGWSHTCARTTAGVVHCWGANNHGQLGDGLETHGTTCETSMSLVDCVSAPVAVMGVTDATSLAVGAQHACALKSTGGVVCWGWNLTRQLGDDTVEDRYSPVPVMGTP